MCTFGTSKHSGTGSQPGRKTKTPSTPENGPGTRLSSDYMSKGQKTTRTKTQRFLKKPPTVPERWASVRVDRLKALTDTVSPHMLTKITARKNVRKQEGARDGDSEAEEELTGWPSTFLVAVVFPCGVWALNSASLLFPPPVCSRKPRHFAICIKRCPFSGEEMIAWEFFAFAIAVQRKDCQQPHTHIYSTCPSVCACVFSRD